jgi:hypothetical protein
MSVVNTEIRQMYNDLLDSRYHITSGIHKFWNVNVNTAIGRIMTDFEYDPDIARINIAKQTPMRQVLNHGYYDTADLQYAIPFDDNVGSIARYNGYGNFDSNVASTATLDYVNNNYLHFVKGDAFSWDNGTRQAPRFDSRADFSICVWIKLCPNGVAGEFLFALKNNLGDWVQFKYQSSTMMNIRVYGNGNNSNQFANPDDNEWHHLALTYLKEDSKGINLYLDGVNVGESTTLSFERLTASTWDILTIGGKTIGENETSGCIMNMLIYNKVLSTDEIITNANCRRPLNVDRLV